MEPIRFHPFKIFISMLQQRIRGARQIALLRGKTFISLARV
jgi:hypothetical protein